MLTVRFLFDTPQEAKAFALGVDYARDQALTVRVDPDDPTVAVVGNRDRSNEERQLDLRLRRD